MKVTIHADIRHVNGSVRGPVEARNGERLLASDVFDLASATSRNRFAKQVARADGNEKGADAVNALLLAELERVRKGATDARDDAKGEIDAGCVSRPEQIIHPDVVGITVAETYLDGGRPAGRNRTYLEWIGTGKREVIDTPDSLKLPDGSHLYLHPKPSTPTPGAPSWSFSSRRRWQAGEQPPNLADVFGQLRDAFTRYVDFPDPEVPALLALWTLLTYIYPTWPAIPYLYFAGPMGSGKTRAADCVARVAFRPMTTSNLSAALLFRALDDKGGTVFYDEAEALKDKTPDAVEKNSILLAGYRRGGCASRLEPVGDTYQPRTFNVYGPKAVCCIRGLPPALASRCVTIRMFRSAAGSAAATRRIDESPDDWARLRDALHEVTLSYLAPLSIALVARPNVCPLSGRDHELWQPLLAIAEAVEDAGAVGLLGMMTDYATRSAAASAEERTPDVDETLLRVLAEKVIEATDDDQLKPPTAGEILLAAQVQHPEFKKWSERSVANVLRRYALITHKSGSRREYRDVTVDQLRRIADRYFLDLNLPSAPPVIASSLSSQPSATPAEQGRIGDFGGTKQGDCVPSYVPAASAEGVVGTQGTMQKQGVA